MAEAFSKEQGELGEVGKKLASLMQVDRLRRVFPRSSKRLCGSGFGTVPADGMAVYRSGHGLSSFLTPFATSSFTSPARRTSRQTFVRRLGGECADAILVC